MCQSYLEVKKIVLIEYKKGPKISKEGFETSFK
jgi:hypothetical protein